ncbi:hypothetical protein ACIQYS_09645 [Psychrobacillus sp. NPDC096426]|uniref:hypothetical protein n=1 Tax=Psychrobacillus sp. NPDC096426 TaxID=3364491 RepID=UPI0037F42BCB
MTEKEIKDLIKKKITHHRKAYRLLSEESKDEFNAGAIVALITLLDEIEESERKEK